MPTTETDALASQVPEAYPTLGLLFSGDAGIVRGVFRALRPGETQLGREVAEELGIGLFSDRRASSVHAVIRMQGDEKTLTLHDCESKNGSFVNGRRVQVCELRDGDLLRVGNSFLLLRYQPARPTDAKVPRLLGTAPAMATLRHGIAEAAKVGATVLLLGESGTGKEVAARSLHELGRNKGPLLAVNCAAIPEQLAESQLFGHVAGAFTGARTPHDGYFRSAHGGTLFLDELGELPPALQAKLLRVLEERQVTPVGGSRPLAVDVWLLAATNRDLIAPAPSAATCTRAWPRPSSICHRCARGGRTSCSCSSTFSARRSSSCRRRSSKRCSCTPGPSTSASCSRSPRS
jgi:hypothetical protein